MGPLHPNFCKHILHINGFLLLSRSELSRRLRKQPAKFCTRLVHYLINSLHRINGQDGGQTVSHEGKIGDGKNTNRKAGFHFASDQHS